MGEIKEDQDISEFGSGHTKQTEKTLSHFVCINGSASPTGFA